jgi:fatty-acyl-CoA synthase
VLATHPDIAMVAVVGIPHPKWGEAVAAIVVPRTGARPNPQALTDLVKTRKGSAHAPKHVEFVDSLPVTSLGKVDKKALNFETAS